MSFEKIKNKEEKNKEWFEKKIEVHGLVINLKETLVESLPLINVNSIRIRREKRFE